MKRMYVKPEIKVEEFVVANVMLAASGPGEGVPIDPNPNTPAANSHRGDWGNLWGRD